jgi:hypothetical protein
VTFKPDATKTPSLSARTLGTSFHFSHNQVVATGCVGSTSCGSSQQVRGVTVAPGPSTRVGDVALDPNKRYSSRCCPGTRAIRW